MNKEKIERIISNIRDRNKEKEVELLHYPTDDERYLTLSVGNCYYYHSFAPPISVPDTMTTDKSVAKDAIKQMRDDYGFGISDCRWALSETNNNIPEAVKLLRSR